SNAGRVELERHVRRQGGDAGDVDPDRAAQRAEHAGVGARVDREAPLAVRQRQVVGRAVAEAHADVARRQLDGAVRALEAEVAGERLTEPAYHHTGARDLGVV